MMQSVRSKHLLVTLEWVCRGVLAAVFILAAVPKILEPLAFAKAVANYRLALPLLGQDYVYFVAIFLPALELAAAIALLVSPFKRAGSLAVGGLLILFIVLITQAVARGLSIDCGCFGVGEVARALGRKVGIEKILEDILWLAMCVFVWWRAKPSRAASAPARVIS